ncbi:MAG: alpha/beta fold hydrolase [Dehalococcoidia bacterium]
MALTHPGFRLRRVRANGLTFAVREWGTPGAPMVVCVPGTGLSSALFAGVEARLAGRWHGFSIDRRGTGLSDKPATGYDFHDFAGDLVALAEALDIHDALALGHSAGGSDVLLAAGSDATRWRALIAMEPTLQDPRSPPSAPYDPAEWQEAYERTLRRKSSFPSFEAAFDRYRQAPVYSHANSDVLREYLGHAFETHEDGSVTLRCLPEHEGQMNAFIGLVMKGRHRPSAGQPDTFAPLLNVRMPTLLVSTGQSGEQYPRMVKLALEFLNHAEHEHFEDAGHLLPLDHPDTVAALAERMRPRR